MNYDLKCTSCGRVFSSEKKTGQVVCPHCSAEVPASQAIKYYASFNENSSAKTEAHGEDYKRVNTILAKAADLVKAGNYSDAEEAVNEALSLTNSDYRVYEAMVAVKTKNYTDLNDETHKPFINKAIELADDDQKKEIKKRYQYYYEKSKLSDEELSETKREEIKSKKLRLEKGLKSLIPEHMAMEGRIKLFIALFPIFFVVGAVIFGVFTFGIKILFLSFAGIALIVGGYVVFRLWFTTRDKVIAFNAFLDLYDLLDEVDLGDDLLIEVYDKFYEIYLKFEDKDPLVSIGFFTVKLVGILLGANDGRINEFIENNKYFSENIPVEYFEEEN